MNGNITKTVFVLAIAAFVAFGFVTFSDENADSDAAAPAEVDYNIYLQLNSKTASYEAWLPAVTEDSISPANFADALRKACSSVGITVAVSDKGWVNGFTFADDKFETAGTWGSAPYWGFSQFYKDANGSWQMVNIFDEGNTIAIVYDEYLFEAPAPEVADKYIEQAFPPTPTYYVPAALDCESVAIGFNMNGHGVCPESLVLMKGVYLDVEDPVADDRYTFGGWYYDKELTMPVGGLDLVTDPCVLYAEWLAPEYDFFLQLNNGTSSFNAWLPTIETTDISSDEFASALKEACALAGIDVVVSGSWVSSFCVNGEVYATAGTWGSAPYWGFGVYYLDAGEWKLVNTYSEGSTIALVFDQYLFEAPAPEVADKYVEQAFPGFDPYYVPAADSNDFQTIAIEMNGHGVRPETVIYEGVSTEYTLGVPENNDPYLFRGWYYDSALTMPCPETVDVNVETILYAKWVAPEYNIYVQLNNGTDSFKAWLPTIYSEVITPGAYSDAFVQACKIVGMEVEIDNGWVKSVTVNGIKYATAGTWGSAPYWGFSQFYLDSDSWKMVNTFDEGNTIAVVFDQYLFEAPAPSEADKYIKQEFPGSPAYYVPKAFPVDSYAVAFVMNGHGTPIDTISVKAGTILDIQTPVDDDVFFFGWYCDAALTTPYDMSAPVNDSMALYASWSEPSFINSNFINGFLIFLLAIMVLVPICFMLGSNKY